MSIWSRISETLSALRQGEGLSAVFERLTTPPERRVAFAIAVIALGAKMAKADGQVTRDEVTAFREVFTIPPGEEKNAARVFNMARTDVAGFDAYARNIRAMYGEGGAPALLNLLEGLFHIALADGEYHPRENDFLRDVAAIFDVEPQAFTRMRARFVPEAERDPYDILGVAADAPIEEVRRAWRTAVRDSHPDRLLAQGVPKEALKLAEKRLIDVNHAWEKINQGAAHADRNL